MNSGATGEGVRRERHDARGGLEELAEGSRTRSSMGQAKRLDAQDAKERGCRDGADGSPGRRPDGKPSVFRP